MPNLKIEVPEHFYKAETICGFTVTSEIKKLWAVELDLFTEFDRVCKKLGLKYFAIGGTLLGAIRHKGFIPWDDDMDFALLWDDFKLFWQNAPREFEHPYYLQSFKSDINADVSPTLKLRNSETTGSTKWEYDNVKFSSHNKGIFIDIFPLFNVPDSQEERDIQKKEIDAAWRAVRGWNAIQNINAGYPSQYEQYISDYESMSRKMSIERIKERYIDSCAFMGETCTEIGLTACRTHFSKLMWKKEWFEDTVQMPFEFTSVLCPNCYEKVLEKHYGDWRTPISNSAMHEIYILDTEVPYYRNPKLKI